MPLRFGRFLPIPLLSTALALLGAGLFPSGLLAQTPTLAPVARIAPPQPASDYAFRLDADGDLLAVVTPSTEETHVFRRGSGFTWSLESVIGPLNNSNFDGRAVAVSQGRISVPSSRGNDIFLPDGTLDTWIVSTGGWQVTFEEDNFLGWQAGSGSSSVRPVRQRVDGGWDYTTSIHYGISSLLGLDFHRDLLALVSSPGSGQYEAHVALRDPVSGDFLPSAQLVPSAADARPRSIAAWGDTVVVGSIDYDVSGQSNQGGVFVFEYDAVNDLWVETQVITASDGAADHWFGDKVDLRGGLLLVAAPRGPSSGQGYLFRRDTTTGLFVEEAILADPLANGAGGFGNALALGDTVAYVKAAADDSVLAFALDASSASTLALDPVPSCVATGSYTFTGQVTGGNAVALVEGDRYGVAPETVCANCGVDPTFSWTTPLEACDNRVIVSMRDELDRTSSQIVDVRYDDEPPLIDLNRCGDRTFTVDPGETVSVQLPAVADVCDSQPWQTANCDNPGPYGAGVTTVTCTGSDQCGNVATCSFTVTVNETQAPAVPEVTLDAPACSATDQATVTGEVFADDPIARLAASVNASAETELCLGCGVDPTFSFTANLAACDNAVRVTAEDDGGQVGESTVTVRYDADAPELVCPEKIYANVPHAGATKAEVFFDAPTASDACDGSLVPDCHRSDADFVQPGDEDFYRLGSMYWSCNKRDTCENRGVCSFGITVLPFGAAVPAEGCEFRDFRDNELLETFIPGLLNAEIGDVVDYEEISYFDGGFLEVQSDVLEPTADNGVILYRTVAGDFRAETPLPELDQGVEVDDVGGLMMRWGLDEQSARAAVLLRPNDPAGPMIEFRVRPDFGLADQEIATRISAVGVTDIALELEGTRVTAQYSTDGGHTWVTPTGGLGGAATVAVTGDTLTGIFVSGATQFGATFVFPYLELCPILGVDPGPGDPPASEEGCRDDDFEDDDLDADWTFTGLGNANQLSIDETGGRLEVTADGATAFTGDDNAGFVYRSMTGDFRVEVTVDGDGMTTGGAFRKAGLMVRSSLDPWAPRLLANLAPYWNNSASESHLQFVARQTQGGPGNLAVATDVVGTARVARLAIERRDDLFIVQYSLDGGATWTTPSGGLGGSVTVTMPATVLVGLDVVSNDISTTSTAAFDDFTLCPICRVDDFEDGELGAPWTLVGLGNANQVSGVEDLGVFALTADGATAFTGADNAGFLYRQVTGDFRAEVTVDGNGMTTGGPFRKTGLMVRSSLDPWAPRLLAQLAPYWNDSPTETHLQFVARQTQGGSGNLAVATDVIGVPRVVRLAIERVDNVFTVEYSLDGGASWTQPTTGLGGSVTVTMPQTVLVGLDMVSNDISITSTSEFDDFALCLGTP